MRTRVGYTGGHKKDPTYRSLGNHTEAIQIDFDPSVITYEKLLDTFWKNHNPWARPWSRQYMAAVFYESKEQKAQAEKTRSEWSEKGKSRGKIVTQIIPASVFYRAEDYHQKYRLRGRSALMKVFKNFFPQERDFVDSTLAARINGMLGGHGSVERLKTEMSSQQAPKGSAEQLQKLLEVVRK